MDSNHRFLDGTQASWPLDHGTAKLRKWESNPPRRAYETPLEPLQSIPQVCPAGVEPACPPWEGGACAARPRTCRARVEGVEPSASGLEPDCSPRSIPL